MNDMLQKQRREFTAAQQWEQFSALKTADDYIDSRRGRNLDVYLLGERIKEPVDHPIVRPSINAMAESYILADEDPDLASAWSSISEQQINRFQSWLMKGSFTDILQRHEVAFVSHRCKFFLFYFHTRGLFYTSEKTDDHHSDSSDHTTTLTSLASEPTDKP